VRRSLPIAGLVAVALVSAAPAEAWRTQRIAREGGDVALAGNARGDAVLATARAGSVWVAQARRGGAFRKPRRVPGSAGGYGPQAAIDSSGNALVLWTYLDETTPEEEADFREGPCCEGIRLTVVSRSGHMRRMQTLTPQGNEIMVEAFGISRGRIAAVWGDYSHRGVRAARRGQRLGRSVRIKGSSGAVAVTPSPRGPDVTIVRSRPGGRAIEEYRVRRGRVGRARVVASGLPRSLPVALVANERGDQVAAWSRGAASMFAATRGRSQRFRIRRVGRAGPLGAPQAAIGPSGAGVVVWEQARGRLVAAGSGPGGVFTHARKFFSNARHEIFGDVELAVNSAGRALIAFERRPYSTRTTFAAAFRSRRGRRSRLHDFGRHHLLGSQHTGALDARGRGRLVWYRRRAVEAARGR
jgi:hypothetical protein